MAGTIEGAKKARETQIKKYGSERAYLEYKRSIASRGGRNSPRTGAFDKNPELARRAGSKGGKISKR